MKCKNCGVTIRRWYRPPFWVHVVEVPGTSRTSAQYVHCRMDVAEPLEEVTDE